MPVKPYSDVFERIEKKYRITPDQRAHFEHFLEQTHRPDAYGLTPVCSLYWDTPEHSLICRSLEKPLYKEKLRVRVYGEAATKALLSLISSGDMPGTAFSLSQEMRAQGQGSSVQAVANLDLCRMRDENAFASASAKGAMELSVNRTTNEPTNNLAHKSISEPVNCLRNELNNKTKIEPTNTSLHADITLPAFLELKKKFKGIVYKRRVVLSLGALLALCDGQTYSEAIRCFPLSDEMLQKKAQSDKSKQIAREILSTWRRYAPYGFAPSMLILVKRCAWEVKPGLNCSCEQLRATFDSDMRAFDLCSNLAAPVWPYGPELLSDGWFYIADARLHILELKNAGSYDMQTAQILSQLSMFPSSFSKYGEAYKLACLHNQKPKNYAKAL